MINKMEYIIIIINLVSKNFLNLISRIYLYFQNNDNEHIEIMPKCMKTI